MNRITPHQDSVIRKMMTCCDPDIGYHKFQCSEHVDKSRIIPFTCKTNICTTCSAIVNDRWGEEIKNYFPETKYLHITFTMPKEFRDFFGIEDDDNWTRKNALYELAWKVLHGYFKQRYKNTKFSLFEGFTTGCIMVLHTFGRKLNLNPHMHIVIPAGGVFEHKEGKYKWKNIETVSKDYLSVAWKRNLLEYILNNTIGLKKHSTKIMNLLSMKNKNEKEITDDFKFIMKIIESSIKDPLEREDWKYVFNVHYYINVSKKADYEDTVCYVARYTRRLPISETNIIDHDIENDTVTYQVKAHDEYTPVDITVDTCIFMNRVIQHIRPKNFKLVRYFGMFANKNKAKYQPILKSLLPFSKPTLIPSWRERQLHYFGQDPLICPCCKKDMILVEKAYLDSNTGKMLRKKIQI